MVTPDGGWLWQEKSGRGLVTKAVSVITADETSRYTEWCLYIQATGLGNSEQK
jgi:hypothetical protein